MKFKSLFKNLQNKLSLKSEAYAKQKAIETENKYMVRSILDLLRRKRTTDIPITIMKVKDDLWISTSHIVNSDFIRMEIYNEIKEDGSIFPIEELTISKTKNDMQVYEYDIKEIFYETTDAEKARKLISYVYDSLNDGYTSFRTIEMLDIEVDKRRKLLQSMRQEFE